MEPDQQGRDRRASDLRRDNMNRARAWAMALEMSYSVVAGGVIGYGIDWYFGTLPWWTLGLCLGGLVFGMVRFIREANRLNRETTRRGRGGGSSGGSGGA